ncbi:hypothetical protein MHLP_01575 [Candidatus Mycoplasma haematolamae str. Purdue]|uniref:Uncharacterized protein n=1 Tax=Mycoplasma haematolamae (strain Purdue) TaxID=1212765 RepID=I7B9E1_MYCHA|nr:hypothetical protein [Candidatus Mycoplasma haematolamae]AFO51895.1 hypothetical protein MHLP_01575 [Candidatus Mycoplasma haematolamae str. Purdue]
MIGLTSLGVVGGTDNVSTNPIKVTLGDGKLTCTGETGQEDKNALTCSLKDHNNLKLSIGDPSESSGKSVIISWETN